MAGRNRKHVLIIHGPRSTYWADGIRMGLLSNERLLVVTLRESLLSGEPLNLKNLIDSSYAVVVINSDTLFTDTITAAIIDYAKSHHKTIAVTIDQPGVAFLSEFSHDYLVFDPSLQSDFWRDLISRVLAKKP